MSPREAVDLMALRFLQSTGEDEIGTIDTEEKFAAALLYCDLKRQGFVTSRNPSPGVVIWSITPAGVAKLEIAHG